MPLRQRFDHRHHPPDLLRLRHRFVARTGGFAADIEHSGTIGDEAIGLSQRIVEREIPATVAE
jgi:hypothetical protein